MLRILALGIAFAAFAQPASAQDLAAKPAAQIDPMEAECLYYSLHGFRSGITEGVCTTNFALPSNVAMKCDLWTQANSFPNDLERRACISLYEARLAAARR